MTGTSEAGRPAGEAPGAAETQPRATLDWRDGVIPVSTRFDDPYFSLANGLSETRHVFLAGNDLPARFAPGFHVAELGFGTGLNLLALLIAWQAGDCPGPLRYTSFEAFPMRAEEIARALAAFPEAEAVAAPFLAAWDSVPVTPLAGAAGGPAGGVRRFRLGSDARPLEVAVRLGDARALLPAWEGRADAWFLDGFSPAKNPELWGEELMAEVARHTAPGGSFATYTAAGFVRRGLAAAGFAVERRPGHAGKRHMSAGRMASPPCSLPGSAPGSPAAILSEPPFPTVSPANPSEPQ